MVAADEGVRWVLLPSIVAWTEMSAEGCEYRLLLLLLLLVRIAERALKVDDGNDESCIHHRDTEVQQKFPVGSRVGNCGI